MNPDQLTTLLNKQLTILGLVAYLPGVPVVSSWIAQDGHYGFIELRNTQEMELALSCLSKVSLCGHQVKVNRTRGSHIIGISEEVQ